MKIVKTVRPLDLQTSTEAITKEEARSIIMNLATEEIVCSWSDTYTYGPSTSDNWIAVIFPYYGEKP